MARSYYRETLADLKAKLAALQEEEQQRRFQHQEILLRFERTRNLVKLLEEELVGDHEDQLRLPATGEAETATDAGTLTERIIEATLRQPGLLSIQLADFFPASHRKSVLTRIGQLVTARRLIKDPHSQRLFPTGLVQAKQEGVVDMD